MMLDPNWIVASRLANGLGRLVEQIQYSIPPLDDLAHEIELLRQYANEIERLVREIRANERRANINRVFGTNLRLITKDPG